MSRTKTRCPFCRRELVLDDEARAALHEWPVCKKFDELASSTKSPPFKSAVDRNDIDKHLDVLAQKGRFG